MNINEKPLLIDTGKGFSIKYKGKYIYSKYSPSKSIKSIIENTILKENTIYLIPSPLLGYGLDNLYKILPKSSILLLIETNEDLYKISNIDVNFIQNGFLFLKILSHIDFSKFRKCELFILNNSYNMHKKDYDRLYNILLNQLHNFWKNKYTLTQMGQLWVKNTLINLKEINKTLPLSQLKTKKPVVVIGAGESTEKILPILKKHQKDIYILAVDTALQILLDYNIKPNGVLALEAQYYNLPDFYGAKNLDVDLIYDISSYPAVPRNIIGNKYVTITRFSDSVLLKKIIEDKIAQNYIPPLGSVGITAIYLALQITECSIFLAGLDFSYTKGKTHSKGTPYHKTSLCSWIRTNPGDSYIQCLKRPLINKINKVGKIENTDSILYEYSQHAKELLHGTNRVFDLTSRGIDLGIPLIDNEDFIKLIINSNMHPINYVEKQFFSDGNKIFIECTININKTLNIIEDIFNNKRTIQSLYPIINEISFLFEHYPEKNPLTVLNEKTLKRFYFTIKRFKRILRIN